MSMIAAPATLERPARFMKWRPRRWELVYEQMVALSTLGKSNTEIAEMYNYTPQHVSNILNTPEASLTRRLMLDKLRDGMAVKIPERLEALADKATQRIAEVLYDDDLAQRSPFQVADRGLAVLKGLGKLKDEANANRTNIGHALIVSPELAAQITGGLAATRRAHELNPPEPIEVEAVELKESA